LFAVHINTSHPYYAKVYVPNLNRSVTVQGMDSLLWALAVAELTTVVFRVNGVDLPPGTPDKWGDSWKRVEFSLRRGQLDLDGGPSDVEKFLHWTIRAAAAVVALLPLEEVTASENLQAGFPEGARVTVQANRYELDRRNRAAAIAIHGCICAACGADFGARYGAIASGFIEVHHLTPVSQLGANYVIDPAKDLVPLCPNCHCVAHRRDPPYSTDELRTLIAQAAVTVSTS
jgi:5-methylcytosine-specific restriction protein A